MKSYIGRRKEPLPPIEGEGPKLALYSLPISSRITITIKITPRMPDGP